MASYNQITIVGNAGRDAELTYYGDNKPMCKFSVGVSKGKDKGSDWFNVVCFGKTANWAAQYVVKGASVMVVGPHQSNKGKDDKYYWSILGNTVQVFGKKEYNGGGTTYDDIAKSIQVDDLDEPF